jgi:hypothetical protein
MVRLRKVWYYCCFGFVPALLGKTAKGISQKAAKAQPHRARTAGAVASVPDCDRVASAPLPGTAPVAVPVEQTPVAPPPNPVTVPKPVSAKPASSPPFPTPSASAGAGRNRALSKPARRTARRRPIAAENHSGRDAAEGAPRGVPSLLSASGFRRAAGPRAEKLPPSTATYRQE